MVYIADHIKSSLIKELYYDDKRMELTVVFRKYYVSCLIYEEVPKFIFEEFTSPRTESLGKFYLSIIKPNFKTKTDKMSDNQPSGVNQSSDQKRFIKMSIDVNSLKKEWFFIGETGKVYANCTLALLPDGEVDKYGNLGMITQDVPKKVYEKEAKLPAEKKTKGPILGNGREYARKNSFVAPGQETEKMGVTDDIADDLPF